MGARENTTQAACLQLLHLVGAFAWRNNTGVARLPGRGGALRPVFFGATGSPDILGILPAPQLGRFIGVECKAPPLTVAGRRRAAGRPSAAQLEFRASVERVGGIYVLAYTSGDLEERLRSLGVLA